MNILVTGGAGFIGSHLIRRLKSGGDKVFVLDNYSRSTDDSAIGYDVASEHDVEVAFTSAVMDFGGHVDEVIHLAYINGTQTFYERPMDVMRVGVEGMLNILAACRTFNVKKFTLVSSSEVCRAVTTVTGSLEETVPLVIPDPYNPRYSYSAGKIMSEMLALHCGQFERLLIARPFNIYGPGMSPGHVIPDFIARARRRDDPFKIIGNGRETRSFCYIDDFIDGIMIMRDKGEHRGIYNVGMPVETTIRDLAETIAHLFDYDPEIIESGELREGDVRRRKPDIRKLWFLGYEPKYSLIEGLRECIK